MLPALVPRQHLITPSKISSGSESSRGRDRHSRRRNEEYQPSEDEENDAHSPRDEVFDDAPSPREEVADNASPRREEVDGDASPTGNPPQAIGSLPLEEQESSGPDHGDHDEVSTPQPKFPLTAALPPLLWGILNDGVWAAMPAEGRNCLGLPNGLAPLKTAVLCELPRRPPSGGKMIERAARQDGGIGHHASCPK